jgi:hypothetical protein
MWRHIITLLEKRRLEVRRQSEAATALWIGLTSSLALIWLWQERC